MTISCPSRAQVFRAASSFVFLTLAAGGATHAQIRPPEVYSLSRYGLAAGSTIEVTATGVNLHDAIEVLTDAPGVSATIVERHDRGPVEITRDPMSTAPPITDHGRRSDLVLRLVARPDAPAGMHRLRVRTPLGTTPAVTFATGSLPERDEGDAAADVLPLPLVVNGALAEEGEVDRYVFDVPAGTELVAAVAAASIGSQIDSLVEIRDAQGAVVARNDDGPDGSRDSLVIHHTNTGGRYSVAVSETMGRRVDRGHYRLSVGALPVVTHVFPLGGAPGTALSLGGANVPPRVVVPADGTRAERAHPLHSTVLDSANGQPLVHGRLVPAAVYDEVLEDEALTASLPGQPLAWPVTVNGRVSARSDGASADHYAVDVQAGDRLTLTTMAERAGSPLDSVIDVLDEGGQPVPYVLLRPVWETTVDLRNRDSRETGLRMLSTAGLRRGDYVLVDREVMRVRELPKSPDEDVTFVDAMGRRLSYFGTSGESHALGRPIYKVDVLPPDAAPAPNGMPLFPLVYRNDDGGPIYGRDSVLTFEAPRAGRYVVRVSDSRGMSGDDFAYRLTVAPPRPDFMLTLNTPAPNVPAGGRVPVTVSAYRFDGFDGPIDVWLEGLDPAFRSSRGTVLPGEYAVSLLVESDADAPPVRSSFRVVGQARVGDVGVRRTADTTRALPVASVARPADVAVASVEPAVLRLAPGERGTVTVRVARHNGFTGRVPLAVRNLPLRTTIPDTGLNGILITEEQAERQFVIEADAGAPALEQHVLVTARWEVNSSGSTEQAALPIVLQVIDPGAAVVPVSDSRQFPPPVSGVSRHVEVAPVSAAARSPGPARVEGVAPRASVAVPDVQPLVAPAADAALLGSDVAQSPTPATVGTPERERPWWGWVFLGRLHPTVVHFPIALIIAGALFELFQVVRRRSVPSEVGTYCLAIGLVGGLVAAWFGTLNAWHQNFSGASADLLERHRFAGWAVVVVAGGALIAGRMLGRSASSRAGVAYAVLLAGSVGLVGAAGHFGGQLVYGEEYVTGVLPWNQETEAPRAAVPLAVEREAPVQQPSAPVAEEAARAGDDPPAVAQADAVAPPPEPPVAAQVSAAPDPAPPAAQVERAQALPAEESGVTVSDLSVDAPTAPTAPPVAGIDFASQIEPIIRETCVECHGTEKVRGRLRMDSIEALKAGGKTGALFVPGDSENSLIIRRVLGLDDEDRMPLDKDPLPDEQIELLKRWVAQGAPFAPMRSDTQQR